MKISILDEEVAKIWVNVRKKDGMRDVAWTIVGEHVLEEEVESEQATTQELKRDLNLKKLMTLDLNDCMFLRFCR